ncbi:type II toxin-antitoxin system PemK/MazF family toxin [Candidatus Woesearchaeota archaeon]|nr:type II toxin-antitoxin system PemK/MazF family toxin [Candidatus Woesearchaeota archaeon]
MASQRDLILLSYPFSDLEAARVRPSIVISNDAYNMEFQDMIVVPLTTNLSFRRYAITLTNDELDKGYLIKESKIKVDRVLSVKQALVRKVIGKVKKEVLTKITKALLEIVKQA